MPPKRSTKQRSPPPPSSPRNLTNRVEDPQTRFPPPDTLCQNSSFAEDDFCNRLVTPLTDEQRGAMTLSSLLPLGEPGDTIVLAVDPAASRCRPCKVKLILPPRKTIDRKTKTKSIRDLEAREIGSRRNLRPIEEPVKLEQDPLATARALVLTARPLKAADQSRDVHGQNTVGSEGVVVEKQVGPYSEPVRSGRGSGRAKGRGLSRKRGRGRSVPDWEIGGVIELDADNGDNSSNTTTCSNTQGEGKNTTSVNPLLSSLLDSSSSLPTIQPLMSPLSQHLEHFSASVSKRGRKGPPEGDQVAEDRLKNAAECGTVAKRYETRGKVLNFMDQEDTEQSIDSSDEADNPGVETMHGHRSDSEDPGFLSDSKGPKPKGRTAQPKQSNKKYRKTGTSAKTIDAAKEKKIVSSPENTHNVPIEDEADSVSQSTINDQLGDMRYNVTFSSQPREPRNAYRSFKRSTDPDSDTAGILINPNRFSWLHMHAGPAAASDYTKDVEVPWVLRIANISDGVNEDDIRQRLIICGGEEERDLNWAASTFQVPTSSPFHPINHVPPPSQHHLCRSTDVISSVGASAASAARMLLATSHTQALRTPTPQPPSRSFITTVRNVKAAVSGPNSSLPSTPSIPIAYKRATSAMRKRRQSLEGSSECEDDKKRGLRGAILLKVVHVERLSTPGIEGSHEYNFVESVPCR
ncbi:hypothetical protein BT69DRAFT_1384180 [Atractiella rhizophila]|nr:hypothetical protein BT69DRAFT_1384180 [Atractiella rhizophila]